MVIEFAGTEGWLWILSYNAQQTNATHKIHRSETGIGGAFRPRISTHPNSAENKTIIGQFGHHVTHEAKNNMIAKNKTTIVGPKILIKIGLMGTKIRNFWTEICSHYSVFVFLLM
jgi:hypothetical protein